VKAAVRALPAELRKELATGVLAARRAAEAAARASLAALGVFADRRPEHLDAEQAALRVGLRAKWRQLGNDRDMVVAECAYEQWHRLLFARFLAENNLLLHPEFEAAVTLDDCAELAAELGEPDAWSVAARFAAEILPGIFRLDDPCVQLRFAPEGRHALERILDALPREVFLADDALGWVYQYWQKDKKDEVNKSERKIGGADLGPVTQLFTENYMVRFLLENSLGAWWAARHPDSPLVKGFEYLRFDDDGTPAAGTFDGWPERVAEVTVMDPCCGSGHFLVEAFSMLWQMRAEEEGISPVEAQDAVLRDNLFGLELDPRCVQIAMFAVALKAWRSGGWRIHLAPNVACSGISVDASVSEWTATVHGNAKLANALARIHEQFRRADELGSLIDPRRASAIDGLGNGQKSFDDVDWEQLVPLLQRAIVKEAKEPAAKVLGLDAIAVARAADLLTRTYTLVVTNPPFLPRIKFNDSLLRIGDEEFVDSKNELATMLLERSRRLASGIGGTLAFVTPQTWLTLARQRRLREKLLRCLSWVMMARLGLQAFDSISSGYVDVFLGIWQRNSTIDGEVAVLDAQKVQACAAKARHLSSSKVKYLPQGLFRRNPDSRVTWDSFGKGSLLATEADSHQGIKTSDNPRFVRQFWEFSSLPSGWLRMLSSPSAAHGYTGRQEVVFWEDGFGKITEICQKGATFRGQAAWGRRGVAISEMGYRYRTPYAGEVFDGTVVVITPRLKKDLAALYAFLGSIDFAEGLAIVNPKLSVSTSSVVKVPVDIDYWRSAAADSDPLLEPWSDDPTQWLFEGRPEVATAPLQVAVGRLLGYRWPEQPESDDLDRFADADGIVCLPAVAREAPAADRLHDLLATAFGSAWSPGKLKQLLEQTGSRKNLDGWLRDEFFKQHCALFGHRPFVWHVWDGRRDGFSALVNYHELDRNKLEKLTYTYLGQDWMERVRVEVRDEVPGAEARLAAAVELQHKLELILAGEDPYDIYVRWKDLHEQPLGWDPDLNDGVRLNVRPFVQAEVLRVKPNVKWTKDRGRNPDGSERRNDRHTTLADKRAARRRSGAT
jgi:hypothetical protein